MSFSLSVAVSDFFRSLHLGAPLTSIGHRNIDTDARLVRLAYWRVKLVHHLLVHHREFIGLVCVGAHTSIYRIWLISSSACPTRH
jgi:hypothetical protein